jgi:hypothetical protein
VPAEEIAVGDVVSVLDAGGNRVTHRVVETGVAADGATLLQLKGDANDVADAQAYVVESADRVVLGIPLAGYAVNLAASPYGLAVAGLLAAGALHLGFSPRRGGGRRATPRCARLVLPAGVGTAVLLGGAVGLTGQAPWAFTSAYWTDSASATVQASTPAPVTHQQPTCTSLEGSGQNKQQAVLSWPGLGAQYEFYWELWKGTSPGGTLAQSGTLAPVGTAGTVSLTFGEIPSGGGGNSPFYARVWTRLVSDHSNVASPTTTVLHSGPRPNGPNWWMYCGTA